MTEKIAEKGPALHNPSTELSINAQNENMFVPDPQRIAEIASKLLDENSSQSQKSSSSIISAELAQKVADSQLKTQPLLGETQEKTKSPLGISERPPERPKTKRTFKVIIIGDANVGKTCLSFRFCNGRFPERTEATIGVDFRERVITLDGEMLRVQLWDTAGQERFRNSMTSHYYRNVQAVVFVYDITNQKSFQNLPHWIDECRHNAVKPGHLPMILIGNKCDLKEASGAGVHGSPVATNEAQKFADAHDMPVFETSAKANSEQDHVESIFMTLVHKLKDCKEIHVQSVEERERREERILRVAEQKNEADEEWGCGC